MFGVYRTPLEKREAFQFQLPRSSLIWLAPYKIIFGPANPSPSREVSDNDRALDLSEVAPNLGEQAALLVAKQPGLGSAQWSSIVMPRPFLTTPTTQ